MGDRPSLEPVMSPELWEPSVDLVPSPVSAVEASSRLSSPELTLRAIGEGVASSTIAENGVPVPEASIAGNGARRRRGSLDLATSATLEP